MIKNYLTIALRQFRRNKVFSLINTIGLAIGIAACLLILQYVVHEWSYDAFIDKGDRIYRVAMHIQEADEPEQTFAFTYPAVAPSMKKDFPEVEEAIRVRRSGYMAKYEENIYMEEVYYVDEPFLEMFSFPLIAGDPKTALTDQRSVVISERIAQKYFGKEPAMGKTLSIERRGEWIPLTVSGILQNVPENSHMAFDILHPYADYSSMMKQVGNDAEGSWRWSDFYTYILLKPDINPENLQAKLPAFAERYMGDSFDQYGYRTEFILQPLPDIHLHSDLGYEFKVNGNASYVFVMTIIAFFILFIAWINYVNLSTARSLDRAKEVGIRKVVGAGRRELIRQFLFETALINVLSFGIGLLVFFVALPFFAELSGKDLTKTLLSSAHFWWISLVVLAMGTLLAGSYPAFILSAFRPINALKSGLQVSQFRLSGPMMRKVLVGVQFCVSVALIAGTLALYRQIQFMRHQDLGVDIEERLVLRNAGRRDSSDMTTYQAFQNTLNQHPEIVNVVASGDVPGKEVGGSANFRWDKMPETSLKRCRMFEIEDGFVEGFGLEMAAGRAFSEAYGDEENNVLINETAAEVLGFDSPEAAIDQTIVPTDPTVFQGRIVGVIKDYHQESLRLDFKPIIYFYDKTDWTYHTLEIQTDDIAGLLAFVERTWKAHFPDKPFQHFFLDEFFDRQYQADLQFGWVIALFTMLAILVACLGLFGLSAFTVARRMKEISIRKVLGATVSQILVLISKEYVRLLLIASVIGLPLAWYISRNWLAEYAFAIELKPWFFIAPIAILLVIAWLTIAGHSLKAALTNPTDNLRSE